MDNLSQQLENIQDGISDIVEIQTEQRLVLNKHMHRISTNEARLILMEELRLDFLKHMSQLQGAVTTFKWAAGLLTFTLVAIQLVKLTWGKI